MIFEYFYIERDLMSKHNFEWVSSVLQDLHNFAAENGLPDTADSINEARIEMCRELNTAYNVEICSDPLCFAKCNEAEQDAKILLFPQNNRQASR